jgi:hypothetical protein
MPKTTRLTGTPKETRVSRQVEQRAAKNLKAGDVTPWYTVAEDAEIIRGQAVVTVQHEDGGYSRRAFEPDHTVPILTT